MQESQKHVVQETGRFLLIVDGWQDMENPDIIVLEKNMLQTY